MRDRPREIIPEQIIATLRQHAPAIFGGRGIDAVYVYGSVATGLAHSFSDVDIALLVNGEKATLPPAERLKLELDIELLIADRCDIDCAEVRIINDAPITFRGQVATQGIRLYSENEEHRIEFETMAWKEYFDYQYYEQMMSKAFWTRLQKRLEENGVPTKSREHAWQS